MGGGKRKATRASRKSLFLLLAAEGFLSSSNGGERDRRSVNWFSFLCYLIEMAPISRVSFSVAVAALVFAVVFPAVQAPAPAPTSDGTAIDQGIAYVLMFLALVLTYLIHPLDASSPYKLF